jgi:hypothetical protein
LDPASPSTRPTRTSTAALSTTFVPRCRMMLSLPVATAALMLASCPDAVKLQQRRGSADLVRRRFLDLSRGFLLCLWCPGLRCPGALALQVVAHGAVPGLAGLLDRSPRNGLVTPPPCGSARLMYSPADSPRRAWPSPGELLRAVRRWRWRRPGSCPAEIEASWPATSETQVYDVPGVPGGHGELLGLDARKRTPISILFRSSHHTTN